MTDQPACSPSTTSDGGDFDEGWRNLFRGQREMDDVITTVIRLSGGGAHPVPIDQIAAAVERPIDQVRTFVDRANAGYPSLRTGHTRDEVRLDFEAADSARFWYQIGERRIGVAGCGPDIFWTAQALRQPMLAEATCPVTGSTISLEFTPSGLRSVHPTSTVVAAVHLGTVPEAATLTDAARVDADVCTQQSFFADEEAAQSWLERHPGGRVFRVADFDTWFREISAPNPSRDVVDRLATPEETGLDPAILVPLLQLLANGHPVDVEDLATAGDRTVEEVRSRLAAVPDTEYDDEGRIVGQGLTLRPTAHRFTVDGQELYTWCALDTLMFPALLNKVARVESTSPTSGQTILLTVDPSQVTSVEPADAVVSLVNPDDMTSIRSSFCNQVHFFTSLDDAEPWLAEHPGAEVLPVAEAYQVGLSLTATVLDRLQNGATYDEATAAGRCNC